MSLVINLTPSEEEKLAEVARQTGLAPEAYAARLVRGHLPGQTSPEDELYAKLRRWQEQDGTPLMPDISAAELFAQWAEEDAEVTDEERMENGRVYAEIEKNGIPRTQI